MKIDHWIHRYSGRTLFLRLLIIASGIIVLSLLAHEFEFYIPRIEIWIKSLGTLGPVVFILLFTVATPFFLSVDALCVAAGVLFPLTSGGFYIIVSTYFAAALIFVLGRYFFRARVNQLLEKQPKLQRLDALLSKDGFRIMFLLRLLPLPFALLSYALSVTEVKFKEYIGSTSGILLYNLALVYFGYTAKHLTTQISNTNVGNHINLPVLILGVVVVLVTLSLIVNRARKMIAQIDPLMVEVNHKNKHGY